MHDILENVDLFFETFVFRLIYRIFLEEKSV